MMMRLVAKKIAQDSGIPRAVVLKELKKYDTHTALDFEKMLEMDDELLFSAYLAMVEEQMERDGK